MKADQRPQAASKEKEYGLVATGASGSWQVSVDETADGAQRWFAQLEGPAHYLYFEISHARVMAEILDFFTQHLQRTVGSAGPPQWSDESDALKLGGGGGHSVSCCGTANRRIAVSFSSAAKGSFAYAPYWSAATSRRWLALWSKCAIRFPKMAYSHARRKAKRTAAAWSTYGAAQRTKLVHGNRH